jgi:hypothetical protein
MVLSRSEKILEFRTRFYTNDPCDVSIHGQQSIEYSNSSIESTDDEYEISVSRRWSAKKPFYGLNLSTLYAFLYIFERYTSGYNLGTVPGGTDGD